MLFFKNWSIIKVLQHLSHIATAPSQSQFAEKWLECVVTAAVLPRQPSYNDCNQGCRAEPMSRSRWVLRFWGEKKEPVSRAVQWWNQKSRAASRAVPWWNLEEPSREPLLFLRLIGSFSLFYIFALCKIFIEIYCPPLPLRELRSALSNGNLILYNSDCKEFWWHFVTPQVCFCGRRLFIITSKAKTRW